MAKRGDGHAIDRPRHAVADLGDGHLPPGKANRAVLQRPGLFAREGGGLCGRWALAGERIGVMGVGVVAGVRRAAGRIRPGLGGLACAANVGAEVAGVAGATLAGDAKPSAVGGVSCPLQMVAGGADASREELSRTAAAAREWAVGIDPHVEPDLVVALEIKAYR